MDINLIESQHVGEHTSDREKHLAQLARFVSHDQATGNLVISNGEARIILQPDGVIRLHAVQIVNEALELIDMQAPRIDLN